MLIRKQLKGGGYSLFDGTIQKGGGHGTAQPVAVKNYNEPQLNLLSGVLSVVSRLPYWILTLGFAASNPAEFTLLQGQTIVEWLPPGKNKDLRP